MFANRSSNDAAIQNNFGYEANGRDRSVIQAEIEQVETELAAAQAELARLQQEASEIEKEQDTDPEWRMARRQYIDTGDMNGINSWYNRRDQRKRDKFNQEMAEKQLRLQEQLSNAQAGERASANEETIKKLEYEVEDKKKVYDRMWKRLTNDGKIPFDSLTSAEKLALDGAMDDYNKSIRALRDAATYSRASKWELMTDHKSPEQQEVPVDQSKTPEQRAAENEAKQGLATRVTTIKNKKHENGKSPRAALDADIKELLEITGKLGPNSPEWQEANNEMTRLQGLKSKEEARAARKAAYDKAVDEWNGVPNKRVYTRGGTKAGKYKASNGVTLDINKDGTPAPFKE